LTARQVQTLMMNNWQTSWTCCCPVIRR